MTAMTQEDFFETLPAFEEFSGVADARHYRPLPDGWSLATADIVSSTSAIERGEYKAVNMAGASVISAVLNALGHRKIPFVFGGDGAILAVPENAVAPTREALALTQAWVKQDLGLDLRAAIVPLSDIRANGLDVRVARFRASSNVTYAMFAGGGANWAESQMKAGKYAVPPAPAGARPDLTGLSCRWDPIAAKNGEIVSIIVTPADEARSGEFAGLVDDIIRIVSGEEQAGLPVPRKFGFPPKGLNYEALASRRGSLLARKLYILAESLAGWLVFRTNVKVGRFDPAAYKNDVAQNTDFRKFDDGLKLTVDIAPALVARLEERLARARDDGLCRYGLHRQSSALMTCFVPNPFARDHFHFIDGAAGGYAVAAANMKAQKLAA
ncbi:DUF3095 domain-containing protein [Taklimakanibacter lacteus]|uniref:DUF3095 domain-containing protein n=1 Tax=Taklimakanibacter lacteus TaxID=2268456 RepID=UPI000E66D58F